MKHIYLEQILIAILLFIGLTITGKANAQTFNADDFGAILNFLKETSADGENMNWEVMGMTEPTIDNIASWGDDHSLGGYVWWENGELYIPYGLFDSEYRITGITLSPPMSSGVKLSGNLELKNMSKLTSLTINDSDLQKLTIEDAPLLTNLSLQQIPLLEEIVIKNCALITTLGYSGFIDGTLFGSQLETVTIEGCPDLNWIDLSGHTSLMTLNIGEDVREKVTNLNISNTALPFSDYSAFTSLESLTCSNNNLTGILDVSGYVNLTTLDCSHNELSGIIPGNVTTFNITGNYIKNSQMKALTSSDLIPGSPTNFFPQKVIDFGEVDLYAPLDLNDEIFAGRTMGCYWYILPEDENIVTREDFDSWMDSWMGSDDFELAFGQYKLTEQNECLFFGEELVGKTLLGMIENQGYGRSTPGAGNTDMLIKIQVLEADNPPLQFQVKTDDGDYTDVANNQTTSIPEGTSASLQISPVDVAWGDYTHWSITYTTEANEEPALTSGVIDKDISTSFEFPRNPHTAVGEYTYTVTALTLSTNPDDDFPITYDYTGDPYIHTIEIKAKSDPGTDPDPEEKAGLQFAVSLGDPNSYRDVANNQTTTVDEGESVYLRISAVTENIVYNTWQIDYTNPQGEKVSSQWVGKDNPYVFNAGKPHTEAGTYVYKVDKLYLAQGGTVYTYSFNHVPYIHTIVIHEDEGTTPPPDPDPIPGIELRGRVETCPTEATVLLPYELLYADEPIEYTILFSDEAKKVGFKDRTESVLLPENSYFTITLPAATPKGIYRGTVHLQSENVPHLIEEYPFEIHVLSGVSITRQPVSISNLCVGDIISLSVEASGEELSYQWYFNETPIKGAVSPTYEVSFEEELAGLYSVEVGGVCGLLVSEIAEVTGSRLYIHMKWDDLMYVLNTDNRYVSFQWYKDGAAIDKYGTSVYYTHAEGLVGTYFVRATRADGTVDESCPKTFDVHTKAFSVDIYPNPVARNENLTIIIHSVKESDEKSRIDLVDMSGRKVYSTTINGNRIDIPMNVTAGSYIAKITTPEGRVTTQVVIVK